MGAKAAFSELYREIVLDHARTPRFAGMLDDGAARAMAKNPLCGDHVSVMLRLDAEGRVDAMRHVTEGCLLCVASASMMAVRVAGLRAGEVTALRTQLETMIAGGGPDPVLGELRSLAGVAAYPSRHQCVLLPWQALSAALSDAAP